MRRVLQPFVQSRTWAELLYALLGLPLGIAAFVFVVTSLALSAGLAITLIGIFLLAASVAMARGIGHVYRGLGRGLLGIEVDTPVAQHRRPGIRGYVTEPTGWRAMAFMLLQFPVAIIDFTVAVSFYAAGLGYLCYPLWWHTNRQGHAGHYHYGQQLSPGVYLNTPWRILGVTVVGLLLLLVSPWVLRGVLVLDRLLIKGLLGPTEADRRIRNLEATRAMAVDDSAASLRRIERDLHDGAQARLVSLAMSLGLAKEELDSSDDPQAAMERVRGLVDAAHREAKGTIIDLRDLARGIHPPALDNGLPDALATLTARSAIPTTLHVDTPDRPSQALESIVYFCTAELITNVVKHSGAHHASVDVRVVDDHLYVRVSDDGAGGAGLGRGGGSGLAGLTDRIATVDGRLDIASPEGGPTLVTIAISL